MKIVLTVVSLVMFQFAFSQTAEAKKEAKADKKECSTEKDCGTDKKASCCDTKGKAVEKAKGEEGKAKSGASCCSTEKKAACSTEEKKEKK